MAAMEVFRDIFASRRQGFSIRYITAMKTAGLPSDETVEEYDLTFHPDLEKRGDVKTSSSLVPRGGESASGYFSCSNIL